MEQVAEEVVLIVAMMVVSGRVVLPIGVSVMAMPMTVCVAVTHMAVTMTVDRAVRVTMPMTVTAVGRTMSMPVARDPNQGQQPVKADGNQ